MRIEPYSPVLFEEWLRLRVALWPDEADQLRDEAAGFLDRVEQGDAALFLAREGKEAVGFAEAAVRHDYVNGCETTPVAFLEGIYVSNAWRKRGIARLLVRAVEDWAAKSGLAELGSDALLDNESSHLMHKALGFTETERVVYFRKRLS